MLRLNNPSLTPPGDFHVRLDGVLIKAGTLNALVKEVATYKRGKGQEPLTVEQVEHCICQEIAKRYPQADNCDSRERPFFADIDAVSTAGTKEVWGPTMWKLLHTKQIGLELHPGQWLRRFHEHLSCPVCSSHFGILMQEFPPDYSEWFKWTWQVHNAVNKSLGKRQYTLEEAKERYGISQ